jgi:hypothetical protein
MRAPTHHVHLIGSQSTLSTQQYSYVVQIGKHTKGKEISQSARYQLMCNIRTECDKTERIKSAAKSSRITGITVFSQNSVLKGIYMSHKCSFFVKTEKRNFMMLSYTLHHSQCESGPHSLNFLIQTPENYGKLTSS